MKPEPKELPDSNSPGLILRQPTQQEPTKISINTSASWIDTLTLSLYLEESKYLATVPLAKDGGMTSWILVDASLAPDNRPILASCETFRKRSLTSNAEGSVKENVVHGIASVFCPIECRGRGYPQRMMRELVTTLRTWQTEEYQCIGSILYSDIGKQYYAKLGWHPNITNSHLEFQPRLDLKGSQTKDILIEDLPSFCQKDEQLVRQAMATPTNENIPLRVTIIPDLDHMLWHISKEEFACKHLFGTVPDAKGAIIGSPGNQVWAIWTHRYYDQLDAESPNNVLYILRLVMEMDPTATRLPSDATKRPSDKDYEIQMQYLKAILKAAQREAAEWKLDVVKLWDPSPLVVNILEQSGMEYKKIDREQDSIASGLWYGNDGEVSKSASLWVNNEHYAWL